MQGLRGGSLIPWVEDLGPAEFPTKVKIYPGSDVYQLPGLFFVICGTLAETVSRMAKNPMNAILIKAIS